MNSTIVMMGTIVLVIQFLASFMVALKMGKASIVVTEKDWNYASQVCETSNGVDSWAYYTIECKNGKTFLTPHD